MSKRHSSVDGFLPRQSGDKLGSLHKVEHRSLSARQVNQKVMYTKDHSGATKLQSSSASRRTLGRADIDESLNSIDKSSEIDKKSQKKRKNKRQSGIRPQKSLTKRIIRWAVILILLGLLGAGIYTGVKFMIAGGNIFQGNFFDLIKNEPLKRDSNGRTNVMIFGTSPEGHDGNLLTDSVMVMSLDQDTKDAFLVSIPRDLWVKYDEPCSVGYQGKFNAVYLCASDYGKNEEAGVQAMQSKITEILGLEIQYYAHVDWDVLKQAVDAVGGIDLTIESSDPRGIRDGNPNCNDRGKCHFIDFKNGERVHLDGETALILARARNAFGGYGLPDSNFDREQNQQRILKALFEKALSIGTLTNLGKVTSLVDAFGDNLKTNFEMKELRTAMNVASNMEVSNIRMLSFIDEDNKLMTTGSFGGQSIVRPVRGVYDFSEIHAFIKKNTSSDPAALESAKISVYNGSEVSGLAQREADKLEGEGFSIASIGNAPSGSYDRVEVYKVSDDAPLTVKSLEKYFSVAVKNSKPPIDVGSGVDFVVILGSDTQGSTN